MNHPQKLFKLSKSHAVSQTEAKCFTWNCANFPLTKTDTSTSLEHFLANRRAKAKAVCFLLHAHVSLLYGQRKVRFQSDHQLKRYQNGSAF